MSLIQVKDLYFYYSEDRPVLKNLNVEFDNRPTAIVGQNGAGKTTLAKLIKGLLKPVSGDIYVDGLNTKQVSVAKLSKIVGFVFQNPDDQIFKSKVLDEVLFGPLNIGLDFEKARENSLKYLSLVGLDKKIDRNPHDLSFSERKLLSIVSVLAMECKIVILDEPTLAQDRKSVEKLEEIIAILKNEGKLVLTITHDMDFVYRIFERTIVMRNGKIVLDKPTREAFEYEDIIQSARLEVPYVIKVQEILSKINKGSL